jgi:KDO2-lipid IV(A) lauroyltransferase
MICRVFCVPEKQKKRKKRKNNVVLDYLAYIALRIALFIIYRFSVETNLRFARYLGRQMWKRYHRGRQRALDNLRASFPERGESWLEETGQHSFESIVMLVMDVLFTPRLVRRENWEKYSTYKNIEQTKWLMQGGQGLLLITGHYGNFELMGYLLGVFGFNVYSIARPLDNRFINNYLYGIREKKGQKIIDKKGASEQMQQLAESNATLCFIVDQDAGKKGLFVDFFGRKASTYKSIALLAMSYDMPVGIASCRRVDDRFFFCIEVHRMIMPDEWEDKDDPINWLTAEYTKAIEDFVRLDPNQYWWLHRRWKTRPREEREKK